MTTTTPRHRADLPREQALADLRRGLARVLVGRDLYADDAVLRAEAGAGPRGPVAAGLTRLTQWRHAARSTTQVLARS